MKGDWIETVIKWSTDGEPKCPHQPADTHYLQRKRPLECRECLAALAPAHAAAFDEAKLLRAIGAGPAWGDTDAGGKFLRLARLAASRGVTMEEIVGSAKGDR